MGGGELLRVGLLPEIIDLKMHWGEVTLNFPKNNSTKTTEIRKLWAKID